ncbi:MAG TPA: pitrilysin family protein [Thermoanaerobaculia bacterium]
MRSIRTTAVASVLSLFAISTLAQVTDHREIQTPQLRSFSIPQPKRIELANGMVIFLQEDRELPLIRGGATIRGGSRDVAADKAGLVNIYAQAWRTGGTGKQTGDQLDEFLEARAARVESGGGVDTTTLALDVMKGDFDTVFPIFLDLLRNPMFREEKIDLAKTQASTSISRRNDDPSGILAREAAKLGYGVDSPYTRETEYATLAAITREDLIAFHNRTVHPNNVILSFIGDFDSVRLEKRLRDTFTSWKRGPQVAKPNVALTSAAPGVYFVQKDDVTQSNIALVHAGIERNHPDFYAIAVMNEIFSGGFSGRLMRNLRSTRGLTYGVGGGIGANWDYPGLFRVQMATKSETTLESVEALREEIARMASEPVTAEELALAKESLLNAFVFTMDTRQKALSQQVMLELHGFPRDYFTRYPAMIGSVTGEDVSRVAKTHIHPDRLALLVVGNASGFERPLSSIGEVTTIDITIPQPGVAAQPTTTDDAGVALANRVAQFLGGKSVVDGVKTLRRTGEMTLNTPQGEMQASTLMLTRYPDSQRTVMTLPVGVITTVLTPQASFMVTPMGSQDLPGSQRDAAMGELRSDLVSVIRNIGDPQYTFASGGTGKAGEVDAEILIVNAAGTTVRWYVDPATGRVLQTVRSAAAPVPGDMITTLSEWKTFNGLNLPTVSVTTRNGEKAAEMRLTAVEVNPTITDEELTQK